jgi:[ribosomal protein S5]-alanine N-acetyltransferase
VPSLPDLPEPISDGSVTLRLGAERDIPEILIAYQDDRRMHERLGLERPPSGAELGRDAERAAIERTAGIHVAMTILETGSDVCRGRIYTTDIEWRHDRAELGMWLAPQVRGRGLGPRALALMSSWLLHNTSLERLQLVTEPDNEPMLSTARAAGYVHEGVLRGYTLEQGRRVDCAILSLLRGDVRG